MFPKFRQHRLVLVLIGVIIAVGASLPAFMSASCLTRPQTAGEVKALENLRAMTRGGVLPSEDAVARIESEFPNTKAAALARIVRARIRINQKDFAGAATLLDSSVIASHSQLGDYALFMRADALEQAGKVAEARAVYERVQRDYPASLRAKEATLDAANILVRDGSSAAVPVLLKGLTAKDDADALLATARAYEETGDQTRALAAYRRLYFYAPASAQSDVAAAIQRLGSTVSPGSSEEAITRAGKLFEAKKYSDALLAYSEAFSRFPDTATAELQLKRVISASNLRRTSDAVSALNSIPASAGETRAEALYHVAQTYARGRQWEPARSTVEE